MWNMWCFLWNIVHLVNSAFDLLVTLFLCIILLVSLETLIKIILTYFVLFFVLKKWFELYINWHHAIGFKVMSMGRNGSSLAWMTTYRKKRTTYWRKGRATYRRRRTTYRWKGGRSQAMGLVWPGWLLHMVRREQRIDERVVLLIERGEQHIVGKVVEHKQWV